MATRVPAPEELLGVDELERKLTELREQVEIKKEEVRSNFLQLHYLLEVREAFLVREMDDIVTRVRQEINEKKGTIKELNKAREGPEGLTMNRLKRVREKHLRELEDEIGKELAGNVTVGWIELEWKREQLEQSVIEVCKVVSLKTGPVVLVDYSEKRRLVWSRDGTSSSKITDPMQLVIDTTTQNIFVADMLDERIQVFDGEGNHLYQISIPSCAIGLALTTDYIFVSTGSHLVKIEKSSNTPIISVVSDVWGIDTNSNSDIYGCDLLYQSVNVFDENLKFLRSIELKTTQVTPNTDTHSIKLYEDMMYVMFGGLYSPVPFHLQVFSQEGELVRCLIEQGEIDLSYFFSIDQSGNVIVADSNRDQIKVFSNGGKVLHTITTDILPGDQEIYCPRGVAIDRNNRIIVAQQNKKCNLLAL